MKAACSDRLLAGVAVASFAAVGVALLSQHVFDMPPCAWCVLQRLVFLCMGAAAGAAWLFRRHPAVRTGGSLLTAGLAVCGALAAYYQHTVAAQMLSCDQTFADRFMTQSGLESAWPQVFGIYATCADAAVEVLGVSYEVWSLGAFVLLGVAALRAGVRRGGR